MEEGILIASDASQEWMLPWWWDNYAQTNHHPVAIVDLGLSKAAKNWCEKRAELISLNSHSLCVLSKEQTAPELVAEWEFLYGPTFWPKRPFFFQKPFACRLSPFKTTLWIDLDCEIKHNLEELFAYKRAPSSFCISRDLIVSFPGRELYNTGVILFTHDHPLIDQWAQESIRSHSRFFGDQDVLSHLLKEGKEPFTELPAIYQWSHFLEPNILARIIHFHGDTGKAAIRNRIQLGRLEGK